MIHDMDREQREEFEAELAAPMEGIANAEANLLANLDQAAVREAQRQAAGGGG